MRSVFSFGLVCLSVVVLFSMSGCATTSPDAAATAAQPVTSWAARQQQLQTITAWQLRGAIGIQHEEKSESASVNWRQLNATHYDLRLFGPFGAGAVEIHGAPGNVSLASNSQPTPVMASNAEILIANQTGWNLPVSSLYYWVRGLPVPNSASQKHLDSHYRLATLRQAGWEVEYLAYDAVNGMDLPTKMTLTNADFRVKLVIKNWLL